MSSVNSKSLGLWLLGAICCAIAATLVVFGGLIPPSMREFPSQDAYGPPAFSYRVVSFDDLPGWRQDDPSPAFDAYLISCAVLAGKDDVAPANPMENLGSQPDLLDLSLGGTIGPWRQACNVALGIDQQFPTQSPARRNTIRAFFEFNFLPVQTLSRRPPLPDGPARRRSPLIEESGTFTGYFEPVYPAAHSRTADATSPVYPRPDDLVEVNLGDFSEDWRGERIAGRIEGARLAPYPDRAAINDGALAGRVEPIAWMDETDHFFLQIQGSGQLIFPDGERLRVNYAGQNGRPYTAIGRVMREQGIMALEDISMQSIRQWLENASPEDARALREYNESFVFFRALEAASLDQGPIGAQGAPLTAGRSLAVDRRFFPLGAPVFVDIEPVEGFGVLPIRRLLVAQDTGGAIRGPVRGDFYWGAGPEAGEIAGRMNAQGRMYVLVPTSLAEALVSRQPPA